MIYANSGTIINNINMIYANSGTTINNNIKKGIEEAAFHPLPGSVFQPHIQNTWTWNPSWMYSSFCQTWKPSFQQGFFRDWIWIILQYWGDNWTYHQIECIYSKIDISYDTYDIHIYHMIGIFVSRDIFMTKTKTWSITQIQNPCLAVHLMFTDSVHENM